MSLHNPATLTRFIRQDFPKAGAHIPTDYLTELDRITSRRATLADGLEVTHADILDAVTAAATTGRNLATDKTLGQLAIRHILHTQLGVTSKLDDAANTQISELTHDHADQLAAALQAAVDNAANTIQTARDTITALDLTNRDGITGIHPEHMTLWGEAYEATHRIRTAVELWAMIGTHTRNVYIHPDMRPLILTDLTIEEWAALDTTTADTPIHTGHPITLATWDEFTSRAQKLRRELDAVADLDDEQRKHMWTRVR